MGPRRSALLFFAVLVALALCCAATSPALEPAGDGWYWQSPQPQGDLLNAVAFGDAANVWAVGDGGTILHSADAGATWHLQSSPTAMSLGSVAFADSTHGWAAGGRGWSDDESMPGATNDGVILATTDGGTTWGVQTTVPGKAVAALSFVDDQQGWAVGNRGLILHTADGGKTWVRQKSGVTRYVMSVTFVDALHGYAGCAYGLVLATSDGGVTWTRLPSQRSLGWSDVNSLAVTVDGSLVAGLGSRTMTGEFARLARSTDGGRVWRRARLGWVYDVWSLATTGDRVVAVGPHQGDSVGAGVGASRVLVSDDDGATWAAHLVGATTQLNAVAANGAGDLCAVGDLTATSSDGGSTWLGRSTRAPSLSAIDMVDHSTGWATGGASGSLFNSLLFLSGGTSGGSILHTADGARWEEQYSQPGGQLAGVDFADAGHGWAVGTRSEILHTSDGGVTWAAQACGVKADFVQVVALTPAEAFLYGVTEARRSLAALVLHTMDAGGTWQQVTLPAGGYPLGLTGVAAGEIWMAGVARSKSGALPVVWHTTDSGATWQRVGLTPAVAEGMIPMAVDFAGSGHGWVLALDLQGSETLAATSDGGASWTRVAASPAWGDDFIGSVDFVDSQHGYAAGTGVYETSDGGATWTRDVTGLGQLFVASAVDQSHAWVAGDGILATVDSQADTAPPVTLSDVTGGWTRYGVTPHLSAADVGASGLASTEYREDGGTWTEGLVPPAFPAPSDHSGDGKHTLEYRSADLAGNTEAVQRVVVRTDTVRPRLRLGTCVVTRRGVLRMRMRIDDASCSSVDRFWFEPRAGSGRWVGRMEWDGFPIRTNRWVTFRDAQIFEEALPAAGTYRIVASVADRAGNRSTRPATGVLVVRHHKKTSTTSGGGAGAGARLVRRGAGRDAMVTGRVSLRQEIAARLAAFVHRVLAGRR